MLDNVRFVLESGAELRGWSEYTINSDFLTPTDGWTVSVGGDKAWDEYGRLIQPDSKLQAWVDGQLVLTGFIDRIEVKNEPGGTTFDIQGRDILRPLCKANIRPDFRVKGLSVLQVVQAVFDLYYKQSPDIQFDSTANRELLGIRAGYQPKSRTAQTKKVIDYCQAHPNEGAFEFLSRNLRRHGLWIWSMADGNVIVGGPSYNQSPAYQISRKRGERQVAYERASYAVDHTNSPSFLEVRGRSTAKEWSKSSVRAAVSNLDIADKHFTEPVYIQHDQAETPEQAQAFAWQENTRLRENERVYQVTAAGHRDRGTGNLFAIDTVASVSDDFCRVYGNFWVASCTMKGGMSGQTTDLKLLPLTDTQGDPYSPIIIGDVDAP